MSKLNNKDLEAIANQVMKNNGVKSVIVADNGTVFRADQEERAAEYSKKNDVKLHKFGKESKPAKESGSDKVELPDGDPTDKWTNAQLQKFMTDNSIEFEGDDNKKDLLEKIAAAKPEE